MDTLLELVQQLGLMAGVAGVIAALVNVGKVVKIVKDGQAANWATGLNLIALGVLFYLKVFRPELGAEFLGVVDQNAGVVAQIITLVLGLVVQLRSSTWTHQTLLANVHVLGKSFSR
jgi:hypothetical protein